MSAGSVTTAAGKYTADFISAELRNWNRSEITFYPLAVGIIIGVSVYNGEDILGIVSAVTGVMYTLLSGKGKRSCYIFGIVNTILYGWLAYKFRVFGDMVLNWGYYLPMQFVGLYFWCRNVQEKSGEVSKRKLSGRERIIITAATAAAWFVFALILSRFQARTPFLDSATTILSITAMILAVMRCFEQWILWTAVNALSVVIWFGIYAEKGNSLAALLMWSVFLVCGVVFARQWLKASGEPS